VRNRVLAAALVLLVLASSVLAPVVTAGAVAQESGGEVSGEIDVIMDAATNGSTATYELANSSKASEFNVSVTGSKSTEAESVSATRLTSGETLDVPVAGTTSPEDEIVTFTGREQSRTVSWSGTNVQSGDSRSVNVLGNLPPENRTVTFTGHSSGEWINKTTADVTQSTNVSLDGLASTKSQAPDPVVNLTGVTSTEWDNESASGLDPNGAQSVNIGGNIAPTGPGGGDALLTVTATQNTATQYESWSGSSRLAGEGNPGLIDSEIAVDNPPDIVSALSMPDLSVTNSVTVTVDVYIVEETPDNTYGEGTQVASSVDLTSGGELIDIQDYATSSDVVTVEFITQSSGGSQNKVKIGFDESASGNYWNYILGGDTSNTYGPDNAYPNIRLLGKAPGDVDVSADGSTYDVGTFTSSGSESIRLPVSTSATQLDFSATGGGSLNTTLELRERTQTTDPGAELNGATLSHSGLLAEGKTVSLTYNQTVLQEGTNQLNISVGDGTLSSDAPTPTVGVNLTHDAVDEQSVDYGGGQWTETYNVSETYASSRASAELTIPFQTNVYQIQTIEAQVNDSGWSSVNTGDYNLSETTLTVDLAGVYGGTIPEGTKMQVRTTGNTVDPIAGTVTVTNPTGPGEPLNSTVEIVDWGPDSALDISGTPRGDRVHYLADATWHADEYSDFEGDGTHILKMPNASADNSFTVRTLPLRIAPKSGDAHVNVPDGRVNRTEPVYRVTPGDTVGDAYDVTFTNATDGEDYVLWSETNEIVVDSGTASSPLTLSDDEDNVAIMQFMLDDGTTGSSTGSSSDGSGVPAPMPTTGGDTNFLPLIGLAIAGGLVVVASRNDGAVAETGANAANSIEGALGRVPIAGPALGKGLGGLVESTAGLLEAVVGNQTVALGIVGAMLVGAVQGGIIEVPQSGLTLIVVAGIGIYSLVALRELGEFTTARWAAILAATTVVTLQTVSEASLLTAIVESQVWPILALALVYLAWQGVQGLNTPDSVTNVQLETEPSDGGDDG